MYQNLKIQNTCRQQCCKSFPIYLLSNAIFIYYSFHRSDIVFNSSYYHRYSIQEGLVSHSRKTWMSKAKSLHWTLGNSIESIFSSQSKFTEFQIGFTPTSNHQIKNLTELRKKCIFQIADSSMATMIVFSIKIKILHVWFVNLYIM